MGKAFSINDLKWGYAATSRKLATGHSNGCVVIWDLEAKALERNRASLLAL